MDTEEDSHKRPDLENPKQFLQRVMGLRVEVVLKWGQSYNGVLASVDDYFNILLGDAVEKVGGCVTGPVGRVLIRCNNVFLIKECAEAS